MSHVLNKEFIATERRAVVLEAIDGLREVQRHRTLSLTESAALAALIRLHSRVISTKGAVLTNEEICRPVAIAQAAMDQVLMRT